MKHVLRFLFSLRETLPGQNDENTGGPATLVDTSPGPQAPAQDVPAAGASAMPDVVPKGSKMSPGQVKESEALKARIFDRVKTHDQAQAAISREIHADQVIDIAALITLHLGIDGDKATATMVRDLFNPYLDVRTTPETHKYTTATLYGGALAVAAIARANPQYKQYFTNWAFLGRCQAQFFKPATKASSGEVPVGPEHTIKSIRLHGSDYALPADALRAGHTMTDVSQAWKNIVRPSIEEIDDLTSARDTARLYREGFDAAAEVGIVVRKLLSMEQGGQKVRRMQKVRVVPISDDRKKQMPTAALAGFLDGMVMVAAKRGLLDDEAVRTALVERIGNPKALIAAAAATDETKADDDNDEDGDED